MNTKLATWIKQPTTVHAIGVLGAMAAGFGMFYATRSPEAAIAAAGGAFTVLAGSMPDNTGEKTNVEHLLADTMNSVKEGRASPAMAMDVCRVLVGLHTGSVVTPSVTAVATLPGPAQTLAPLAQAVGAAAVSSPATGVALGKAVEAAQLAASLAPVVSDAEAAIANLHPGLG